MGIWSLGKRIQSNVGCISLMGSIHKINRLMGSLRFRFIGVRGTILEHIGVVTLDSHRLQKGFTVVELLIVFGIVGSLAGIAIPRYIKYLEQVDISVAIADISHISKEISSYNLEHKNFPDTLDDLGLNNAIDPWGNPYQYLRLEGESQGARKDQFLKPINSDFDLYSMGPDGLTNKNLNSGNSLDDVIRCNDGGYIGTVANY